ncbi:MAG: hypothetical protein GX638_15320 [Crenarchaeota archaeon]|nr:hypothetical protein [Thermoproteota archaeon]
MPCVSSDGKLTANAIGLLKSIKEGTPTPEGIANKTGQALFKVRSGLRELKNAEFIEETEQNKYRLSEKGKTAIQ